MGAKVPNYPVNLVVGLGNYGEEFKNTRHNIAFEVLDQLNSSNQKWNQGEHGLWCLDKYNNSVLIKPITGMNLCGLAVHDGYVSLSQTHDCQTIVIHDDMDFEPGIVRIKKSGGHGRHNGLKSVIQQIGEDFIRVRVGIGKAPNKSIDHVLGRFTGPERKIINNAILDAAEAVVCIIRDGLNKSMNKFNQRSTNV